MPVYWSIFFLSIIFLLHSSKVTQSLETEDGKIIYYTPKYLYMFSAIYLLFWVSCRDVVLDTYMYKAKFYAMPSTFDLMIKSVMDSTNGYGFELLQGLFKIFIGNNHYLWFGFLGAISLFMIFRTFRKFSIDVSLSYYLFIASTAFTWMVNGTRQFIAVCILFGVCDWLINGDQRHKIYYYLLIIVVSSIHSSALFLLPICFFTSRGKLLDKWMIFIVIATVVLMNYSNYVIDVAMDVMNKDYSDSLKEGRGSSIARLLVSAVPLILVLFKINEVRLKATPDIIFFINMSLVGVCFYFVSTFTNGILIGRMPIYFTLYNYILIPWLLKNVYTDILIKIACVFLYAFYFYYQMHVAWNDLTYVSEILNIYCYNRLGL